VYKGRKKALTAEDVAAIQKRIGAGEQKAKIAREYGISRKTLYGYVREKVSK
jgi:DNA invertase Pin-like site-specific DNA recombinase